MGEMITCPDDFVFGLDIGTRNVVGTVGYMNHGRFQVVSIVTKEHDTRAMLDGQIHDINKVGETIRQVKRELEYKTGKRLKDVCIAAAGRVLRTINCHEEVDFEDEVRVDQENIYSLELIAVEKAHKEINAKEKKYKFYCVGYTTVKYYLNDYVINNLEGHKANKIGVDILATFLPEEVVDGLYAAVDNAGLSVANLTLEPIAAMNVAIPEQFRLLNIGLVDVGAGTSDICLTKDGSVLAYGMIPSAGDGMTEIIAKEYLVDFTAAEKIKLDASKKKTVSYKDIMGISHKINSVDVKKLLDKQITGLANEVADKICELNGGKPVSAVFVVGGGGKFPGFTDKMADRLKISHERVAVRGEEVLGQIDFLMTDVKKDALLVTPIGICINYYNQKNNFIFATVNDERIKLYDNNHLTVVDAVMQSGLSKDSIFPKRGKELTYKVNGKDRFTRGTTGDSALILLNDKEVGINEKITRNDRIVIKESTAGAPGHITIGELEEYKSTINFVVNGKQITCPKFAYVNKAMQPANYEVCEGDDIVMENYYNLEQLFNFMDVKLDGLKVWVNNVIASGNTIVYENFDVRYEEDTYLDKDEETDSQEESVEDSKETKNSKDTKKTKKSEAEPMENNTKHVVNITVNGSRVVMSGKDKYTFVDVFDFYPFDLKNPKGTNLIALVNGQGTAFTAQLFEGDTVELYWK